jgi:citrate synthase
MLSGPYKIGRPRQLYTGYEKRDIVELKDRK